MGLTKVEEDRLYNRTPVNSNTSHSPDIAAGDPEKNKPGAKPLETYLEPDDYEAYGFTQEKILENYRFYGTLMKRKQGNFRLKERIAKSNAKNIEEIDDIYGSGHYQLRVETADGGEDRIDFQIPDTEDDQPKKTQQPPNSNYYHTVRREIRQEVRHEMKDIVDSLETRVRLKDNELDEKSKKIRSLSEEIGQLQRNTWGQAKGEIDRLRDRVDDLKTELQNKDMEIIKLEMDLQYADVDRDQDWFDRVQTIFEKALEHPAFSRMMAQKSPAMLNGASNGQSAAESQKENQSTQENEQSQQNNPSVMQQIATVLFQNAVQQLQADQPDQSAIADLIDQVKAHAKKQGIGKIPADSWVTAAKGIVDYALQNNTPSHKVAQVIEPIILKQVTGADAMIANMPTNTAVNMLLNYLNLEVSETQKEFVTNIISILKDQVN